MTQKVNKQLPVSQTQGLDLPLSAHEVKSSHEMWGWDTSRDLNIQKEEEDNSNPSYTVGMSSGLQVRIRLCDEYWIPWPVCSTANL